MMMRIETILYWIAIFIYVVSSVSWIIIRIFKFKNLKINKFLDKLIFSGFIVHTVTVIMRWITSGHIPVMGDYENTLAGSWAVLGLFYLVRIKWRQLNNLLLIIIPVVVLMMGFGLTDDSPAGPLTPPYQSPWLIVHIIFAWFAYAPFTISFAMAVVILAKNKNPDFQANNLKKLDKLSSDFIVFGFINLTIMIVSGSIWANLLWGSYWNWDPVETWSLICWLLYGLYMHLRFTYKWKDKKASWLNIASFGGMIMSFWGTNLLGKGLHIFNLIR